MAKNNDYDAEEMTVELELEDGTNVNCAVITILTVENKDYIVLLPLDEDARAADLGRRRKQGKGGHDLRLQPKPCRPHPHGL